MPRNLREATQCAYLGGVGPIGQRFEPIRWLSVRQVLRWARASAIAIICVVTLLGCTTQLQVEALKALQEKGDDHKGPLKGVVYYLPTVEFVIAATWTLAYCEKERAHAKLSFEVSDHYVADRTRPFLLDYTELEAFFKHTDVSVSLYSNGTLKSINGNIEDRTGTVVGSALALAKSVAQMQPLQTPQNENGETTKCTEKAEKALQSRKKLSPEIEELQRKIVATSEQNPLTHKSLKRLARLNRKVAAKRAAFATRWAETSFKESFPWTPSEVQEQKRFFMNDRGRCKLFREAYMPSNLCFQTVLKPHDSTNKKPDSKNNDSGSWASSKNPDKHLIYRIPASATLELRVCDHGTLGELLASRDVQLPQFGVDVALPLVNAAFDQANLVVDFDERGALTNFQYISRAQLEGLTQALAETAKAAKKISETRKGRELKKVQAKTELLKAKAELIKAERDLQALEDVGGAQPSP